MLKGLPILKGLPMLKGLYMLKGMYMLKSMYMLKGMYMSGIETSGEEWVVKGRSGVKGRYDTKCRSKVLGV
jgi:hypothetical protein